jgi:hypothetical protein
VPAAARIALAELDRGLRAAWPPRRPWCLFSAEALETWTAAARELFGEPTE